MALLVCCGTCGKEFRTYPSVVKRGGGKFCSRSCSGRASGQRVTEETRRKLSESAKRWHQDPGFRKRRSKAIRKGLAAVHEERVEAIRKTWQQPEMREMSRRKERKGRKRRVAAFKERLSDPTWRNEFGRRVSEGMTPEIRKQISKRVKREWREMSVEEQAAVTERLRVAMHRLQEERGPTSIEAAVCATLDSLGIEYEFQKQIDRLRVDVFVPSYNLVIECDGDYWHNLPHVRERDRRRDAWLRSNGYRVVRVWGSKIEQDPEAAVRWAFRRAAEWQ